MKWAKRNETLRTVTDIVTNRTKMAETDLDCDKRAYEYPNIDKAVDLLFKHLKANSKICVYGDYDCDGITSISILKTLFSTLNYKNVDFITPRRFTDGYGINIKRLNEIHIKRKCNLLITIDNGIAALETIEAATRLNIDTIILDHHEAFIDENGKTILPKASIIVDPHITGGYLKADKNHIFDDLCGAGIGYYFSKEALKRIPFLGEMKKAVNNIIIFAGIGTIADLVSLTDDNRRIVKSALKLIKDGFGTKGLRALIKENNIDYTKITSTDIAFKIAPCLNASGRLYDDGASKMVSLLYYDNDDDFLTEMVRDAITANEDRKKMTKNAIKKANALKEFNDSKKAIVIFDKELSPGIAGLVASEFTEKYYCPSIVLAFDKNKGIYKGSGRSIPEINLKELLDKVQNHILQYGGHPMAAGLSIDPSEEKTFKNAINSITPHVDRPDVIFYDIDTEPNKEKLLSIYNDLQRFEPYGQDNAPLSIMIKSIELGDEFGNDYRIIGKDKTHIKFFTKYGFDMLYFNGANEYSSINKPKCIDVIGTLGINTFNGKSTLQVLINNIRKSI